jgi:DNA invertase Pin-like site-specific DNA recombinase
MSRLPVIHVSWNDASAYVAWENPRINPVQSKLRASKPAPAAEPARRQTVIYARVSSKEQEKEGFSIPAQLKLLKEYAAANGFAIAQEYVDVETAKQTGRAAFGEMVAYLKAHPSVRLMLVEKTDRLYRNLKDWVTVDELDVEMHFPKEGVVLSRESRSSEKFMHGIKVLMAKNYIDNLSEEARKGMQEKAEQGIWPTKCPLGYRNITGSGASLVGRHHRLRSNAVRDRTGCLGREDSNSQMSF